MILLGEYQMLLIVREMPQGYYLECDEGYEVLMPRRYVTPEMEMNTEIEVFVYCDSEDRDIATTEHPKFIVDQFAFLEVVDVNTVGAFCDWGVSKELFIPFSNQNYKLERGDHAVVHMFVDVASDRLVGTTKLHKYLKHIAEDDLVKGQEVDLLVSAQTDLGFNCIVNQKYKGLIYKNEVPTKLQPGQTLKGYIKPMRPDGKIDLSLHPIGHQSIEPNAQKILDQLASKEGFLPFNDKSDPDDIRRAFGISKKLFKKAIGALYKSKVVDIKEDGLHLIAPLERNDKSEEE